MANLASAARPAAAATPDKHTQPFLPALSSVDAGSWRALGDNAVEPNAFYLAGWESEIDAHAASRGNVEALIAKASDPQRLIGLLPVISAKRAYRIPLPVLVSADPYGSLRTPLLDRACADDAAAALLKQARDSGARALMLREIPVHGEALAAFRRALERDGLAPEILGAHVRASLDATRNADELLHDALGSKKLKELRRQRHRLEDAGDVTFTVASTPDAARRELDVFLALEASGWKGQRGTALSQDDGDMAFIRNATATLAQNGQCEIVTLRAGEFPVASGIVLRHLDRAFFFKIGVDDRFAKFSPGVQLTLELTRHLCADPAIRLADSIAVQGHPMIDPIWRERIGICDMLVPLYARDPAVTAFRFAYNARDKARRAVHAIRRLRETIK